MQRSRASAAHLNSDRESETPRAQQRTGCKLTNGIRASVANCPDGRPDLGSAHGLPTASHEGTHTTVGGRMCKRMARPPTRTLSSTMCERSMRVTSHFPNAFVSSRRGGRAPDRLRSSSGKGAHSHLLRYSRPPSQASDRRKPPTRSLRPLPCMIPAVPTDGQWKVDQNRIVA